MHLHHREARHVAVEFLQPLQRPGARHPGQHARRDVVALLQHGTEAIRIEQAERTLEHRAQRLARLQDVDRLLLHQRLQPLAERRLAAAHRAEQIKDLLPLLEPLRRVAEEADDPFDRLLHAVEVGERRINPKRAIHEDAGQSRVARRVDAFRLADRLQHPFRRAGIGAAVGPAELEVIGKAHLGFATLVAERGGERENVERSHSQSSWPPAP